MFVWRGWGWLGFGMPILWALILMGVVGYFEPWGVSQSHYFASLFGVSDEVGTYYFGAMVLAISAVTLWPISRYRTRMGADHDSFTYIPMKYWTYVFAVGAVGVYIASHFVTGS